MTKPKVPEEEHLAGFGRFLRLQQDRIRDSFMHSDRRLAKAREEVAAETAEMPVGDCQVQMKGHAHGHVEDEPFYQRPLME